MYKAPILLLVFNRPTLTKRVFDCIRKYRPNKLYVSADGPRFNVTDDLELCAKTLEIFNQIDWECELITNFSEFNKGCRVAVYEGISWFFQHEEMGIILEDDILPEPAFFEFCSKALYFYYEYQSVGIISGMNFSDSKFSGDQILTCRFSNYAFIWGWATWKRTWDLYSPDLKDWDGEDINFLKHVRYINSRLINTWKYLFFLIKFENYNTWDYQLNYLLFKFRLINVVPSHSLIDNIGFGNNSTHTRESKPKWLKPVKTNFSEIVFNLNFEDLIENKHFTSKVFADNLINNIKFSLKQVVLFFVRTIIFKK